jgi:hypothetical protein
MARSDNCSWRHKKQCILTLTVHTPQHTRSLFLTVFCSSFFPLPYSSLLPALQLPPICTCLSGDVVCQLPKTEGTVLPPHSARKALVDPSLRSTAGHTICRGRWTANALKRQVSRHPSIVPRQPGKRDFRVAIIVHILPILHNTAMSTARTQIRRYGAASSRKHLLYDR